MKISKLITATTIITALSVAAAGCATATVPDTFNFEGTLYFPGSMDIDPDTRAHYAFNCWKRQKESDDARVIKQNTALSLSALTIGATTASTVIAGTVALNNQSDYKFLSDEMVIAGSVGLIAFAALATAFGGTSLLLASPKAVESDIKSAAEYGKKKNFAIRSTLEQIRNTSACE